MYNAGQAPPNYPNDHIPGNKLCLCTYCVRKINESQAPKFDRGRKNLIRAEADEGVVEVAITTKDGNTRKYFNLKVTPEFILSGDYCYFLRSEATPVDTRLATIHTCVKHYVVIEWK